MYRYSCIKDFSNPVGTMEWSSKLVGLALLRSGHVHKHTVPNVEVWRFGLPVIKVLLLLLGILD
jgi:hypothetical protein